MITDEDAPAFQNGNRGRPLRENYTLKRNSTAFRHIGPSDSGHTLGARSDHLEAHGEGCLGEPAVVGEDR